MGNRILDGSSGLDPASGTYSGRCRCDHSVQSPTFPVNVQWGLNNFPGEKFFFGERRLQKQVAMSMSQNSSPFGPTVLLISLQITLSAQPTTTRPSEGSRTRSRCKCSYPKCSTRCLIRKLTTKRHQPRRGTNNVEVPTRCY
jgi:hypothetical protein